MHGDGLVVVGGSVTPAARGLAGVVTGVTRKDNPTWKDPIVEEVRKARDEYARRFNYDVEAICEDLRKKEEQARREGARCIDTPRQPAATEQAAATVKK